MCSSDLLETARLQHEQAVAKAQAEMMARVQAEQKALAEKRARAAAEDRAKQEAVARVMQEHQMRQNAEKEIQAKVEAEIKARAQADFDAEVRARTEAQQRAEAVAAQRYLEDEEASRHDAAREGPRKPIPWMRIVVTTLVLLVITALAVIQVMPMTGFIPNVEKLVSERVQAPVAIGGMRFNLFPSPQLKLDNVAIGQGQDVRIDAALIDLGPGALFDEHKQFDEIQLSGIKLDQDALLRLNDFVQAPPSARLDVQRLKMTGIKQIGRAHV